MSWEREPLFTKAKLFMQRAYEEEKDSSFFGLWCAMGLELLARSAVASVSPTLLAEPDSEHHNLMYALNLGISPKKKSLGTIQVLKLCQTLIKDFVDYHFKTASAIINQRNEELHSGGAAFNDYSIEQWISGFYKCCKILSEFQKESLGTLFDPDVLREAELVIEEGEKELEHKTKSLVAAHTKVFESKSDAEKKELRANAETSTKKFSYHGHHRVNCPSCASISLVAGEPFGKEHVEANVNEIITRQSILPTKFECTACGLKLIGYNTLAIVGLAGHFTRKYIYSPEEYYDMINPDDYEAISEKYRQINYDEYNNE